MEQAASGERILLLAPTGRDAELLADILARSGLESATCPDIVSLCASLREGGAVAVVAEEALSATPADGLEGTLAAQPSWSDLPVIILLSTGATLASSRALLSRFSRHGTVTLLERPVRTVALISTLQSALRARRHQYEVRDHLWQRSIALAVIEHSESRYRSLTMASASIVWVTNADGAFLPDGPLWEAYTGQTPQEYMGWGWLDAIHPEDRELTAAAWRRAIEGKEFYYAEYRLRRHDGQYRRVTSRGVPVLGIDGVLVEWVGACTDVEDERRAPTTCVRPSA